MKIGISKYPFTSFDKSYEELRGYGFECIDYSISNTDTFIYQAEGEEFDGYIAREREHARKAGIEISQIHGPWRWPAKDGTPEERAERLAMMKKGVRITAGLGCENMVIHPIMPFGTHDKEIGKESETHELNLVFMRELVAFAKEYGVTVCIENMPMPAFSIGTPREILEFVKEINEDNFKICLDTGHVATYGKELSLADEVIALGDYLRVLHVHDSIAGKDLHLMPRFGILNWESFADALRVVGFCGSFSLETTPARSLPDDIKADIYKVLFKIAKDIIG